MSHILTALLAAVFGVYCAVAAIKENCDTELPLRMLGADYICKPVQKEPS